MTKTNNDVFATIGPKVKLTTPTERDQEFAANWKKYESKVRRTAELYHIPGCVGVDLDDLVQLGQSVLLHALRTHNSSGAFSTYFYHCLQQRFADSARAYGRSKYLVVGIHSVTDEVKQMPCVGSSLHQVQTEMRMNGYIPHVINKTPRTGRPTPELMRSIDAPVERSDSSDNSDTSDTTLGSDLSEPDMLTNDDMICLIRKTLPNQRLQQIAVWLYVGHKANGKNGIMRRMGLKRHQYDRAIQQIRMILAGELNVHWTGV